MLTGIELTFFLVFGCAVFLVLSSVLAATAVLSRRHLHRTFTIRRRLGG
jgi:hypothetical protein